MHATTIMLQMDINLSCTFNHKAQARRKTSHPPKSEKNDNLERKIHQYAPLPPFSILQTLEQQLEPITQSTHILIRILLQLKRIRDDLDRPILHRRVLPGFEAEEEVAGVFWVDAEGVDGAFGVRFGVGGEPALWKQVC
jgi:hypothetical protein